MREFLFIDLEARDFNGTRTFIMRGGRPQMAKRSALERFMVKHGLHIVNIYSVERDDFAVANELVRQFGTVYRNPCSEYQS